MQIQIENTTFCNAKCCFCPQPTMKRKKMTMPLELHKKIVDEACGIPHFDLLTITGLGEPLIDKNIVEKVRYSRKRMAPNVAVDVYTNGTLLTVDLAKEFADAGLNTLMVSLNAMRAEKRREIMGLNDYDRVVETIWKCFDAVKGSDLGIVVKAIVTKDLMEGDEQLKFMETWGGRLEEGGHAFLHLEGNWAGWNYKVRTTQTVPCSRALSTVMVLVDGRMSLCCQDAEGQVTFGDLNKESIRSIYQKKEYVRIRKAHIDGHRNKLFMCKDCAMI
jgi:uncharacterized Fe-S cluster-containing radical SAM superfamily enzyme